MDNSAYQLTSYALCNLPHPENRYLYVVCHARIGTDVAMIEAKLQLSDTDGDNGDQQQQNFPGEATRLFLLASTNHKSGRRDDAVAAYITTVTQYPLMWVALNYSPLSESSPHHTILYRRYRMRGHCKRCSPRPRSHPVFAQVTTTPRRRQWW